MLASVAAGRTSIDPLGAGALLAGVLFGCGGAGALVGVGLDSVGIGIAIGALIGIRRRFSPSTAVTGTLSDA
jgi:hypothetical protein